MDILTHTLSGITAGTVVASFSKRGLVQKYLIVVVGGFAGALPDIDAISLWSGFDATFGRLFSLNHTGKEIYSAKLWYSHHAFMHSIAAALLIALLIGVFTYLVAVQFKKFQLAGLLQSVKANKLISFSFILGFLIHLLEDMPTPASSWGGVNLLWPLSNYTGGYGDIWWWNNYDIFLIVLSVFVINLTLLSIGSIKRYAKSKMVLCVCIIGFIAVLIQIKTRSFDFSYVGNTNSYNNYELKSKELQRDILGDELFKKMESFDKKLDIYF